MSAITADQINSFMETLAIENGIPEDIFNTKKTANGYSIRLKNQVVFNSFIGKKVAHITPKNMFDYDLSSFTGVATDGKSIKIYLSSIVDLKRFKDYFIFVLIEEYKGLIRDHFSCCSRYIECSDAKKCVHEDQNHAENCAYRKNLMNGKIFYGYNKNI